MANFVEMVRLTNPNRSVDDITRRLIKVLEELGEIAEAYVNVTSEYNGKNKSWDDVREEIVDVLILSIDISLISLPKIPDNTHVAPKPTILFEYDSFEKNISKFVKAVSSVMTHLFESNVNYTMVRIMCNYMASCAFRLAYTPMPDKTGISITQLENELEIEMDRKLTKWKNKMAKMSVIDSAV